MGASVGMAHGMEMARGSKSAESTVAVIGDSTFIHSGITGLINTVYNGGTSTVILMDNSITGMTGHQQNPATGKNIRLKEAPQLDLEALVRAVGVEHVRVVDPFDTPALEQAVREETARRAPSVIITKRPCELLIKTEKHSLVINDKCRRCGKCLKLGCPAIEKTADGMRINNTLCVACGLCAPVCPFGAIGGEE
jgi:indolepyruvate ferredoxin oxidoreductase alpha subunit